MRRSEAVDQVDRAEELVKHHESRAEDLNKALTLTRTSREFNRNRVMELELLLHSETERADQNKEWAERAESLLADQAASYSSEIARLMGVEKELRRVVEDVTRRLNRANKVMFDPSITSVLRTTWEGGSGAASMAAAIKLCRTALVTPASATSQD